MGRTAYIRAVGILMVILVSCDGLKDTQTLENISLPKPEWISQRPLSSSYYIGVGVASKLREPLDFGQVAKKNALNDLASEISVIIEGETFLNTLEVNESFREEFVSNITTKTRERIEGYEMSGAWENDEEYWVLYRLSKSEHARIQKEKKDQALYAAADLYKRALEEKALNNFSASADQHIKALLAMKDYWTENNEYLFDGENIHLDHEIYSSLNRLASDTRIEPDVSSIVLSYQNNFIQPVKVLVHNQGNPLRNVAIGFTYDQGKYVRPKASRTGDDGTVIIRVQDANIANKNNKLMLTVRLDDMISGNDDKAMKALIKSLHADSKEIPIEVMMPVVAVVMNEKDFDEPVPTPQLGYALQNALTSKGFRITQLEDDANYIIKLTSNTTRGGTSQGFHVAYLQMNMNVMDAATGEEIYTHQITKLKGLQLNYPSASLEAIKNGQKKIEKDITKELLEAIL